jgi:hypothetical protein
MRLFQVLIPLCPYEGSLRPDQLIVSVFFNTLTMGKMISDESPSCFSVMPMSFRFDFHPAVA